MQDRALFAAAAEHYVRNYESGFNADGYGSEGLGYWNYGFSHFVELRENLFRVTQGRIDLLANAKMQKVAMFGLQFPMMPDNAAAFGDAGWMPHADPHLLAVLDRIFQLSPGTAAVPQAPEHNVHHGGLTTVTLDLFPIGGDNLPTPAAMARHELQTYYADSGVLVSRPGPGQKLAVTIKASGNTHHSHNDVGSFVIGLQDVQPVGDPGGPKFYSRSTFGPQRLDAKLLNSFGHPVPEIDGHLQRDATKVKAPVLSHALSASEDRIEIDLTPAYDAPELRKLTRTLVHNRTGVGSIAISDRFQLSKPAMIVESMPTYGTWQKVDDRTLLFTLGGKRLQAVIEGPGPAMFTETKVAYNGRNFTRVEARMLVQDSGTITMRFEAK